MPAAVNRSLCNVLCIAKKRSRRPLTLGDIDEDVEKFVKALRTTGTCVTAAVVLAAATGIVTAKDRPLLREHKGHVTLTMNWAE